MRELGGQRGEAILLGVGEEVRDKDDLGRPRLGDDAGSARGVEVWGASVGERSTVARGALLQSVEEPADGRRVADLAALKCAFQLGEPADDGDLEVVGPR